MAIETKREIVYKFEAMLNETLDSSGARAINRDSLQEGLF